jgi:hypothetical protein
MTSALRIFWALRLMVTSYERPRQRISNTQKSEDPGTPRTDVE